MDSLPVDDILRIAGRHGATRVRVFGSRSRGDATASSDLDLLIDVRPDTSLFDLIRMEDELEALLGIEVEVVTEGGLKSRLRDNILSEARPLSAA